MLLMWIGELVTEFGIGNGVSLIILAGIMARVPSSLSEAVFASSAANIPAYIAFFALAIAIVYAVVVVSDAERSIPIAYARQVRGAALSNNAATYLPIRLLQAGVIPIIFALSLLLLPQMALSVLSAAHISFAASASLWYSAFLSNPWNTGQFTSPSSSSLPTSIRPSPSSRTASRRTCRRPAPSSPACAPAARPRNTSARSSIASRSRAPSSSASLRWRLLSSRG